MSGCERYGTEVGSYLDGELEPRLRSGFEAHLSDCGACRQALRAQRRLAEALRGLPRLEPGPQFEPRFWARLAREEDHSPGWRARLARWSPGSPLKWALGAAALATLALLLSLRDPGLPAEDWAIVSDAEQFELLESTDLELLAALDVLEPLAELPEERAGERE